jgi:hypothetical protein
VETLVGQGNTQTDMVPFRCWHLGYYLRWTSAAYRTRQEATMSKIEEVFVVSADGRRIPFRQWVAENEAKQHPDLIEDFDDDPPDVPELTDQDKIEAVIDYMKAIGMKVQQWQANTLRIIMTANHD